MLYTAFKDKKISRLGFGTMRLPLLDGGTLADIDEEESAKMFDLAIKAGVNYFDTAQPYHLGKSEKVTGKILQKYPRASFYFADKFPGHIGENLKHIEDVFETQLAATQMKYFDFYLLHNVCELDIEEYLEVAPKMISFLKAKRDEGIIHHIGFSIHGPLEMLMRFLAAYGEIIEFCQIQLNWFDWNFQDAKAKVEYLNEHNIPIWVMEPLRGGRLVTDLPDDVTMFRRMLRGSESAVETAFRFLQSVPGVSVILSGMSTPAQVEENLRYFEAEKKMTEEDKELLLEIAGGIHQGVPCTKCNYCAAECRRGLNISKLIGIYNDYLFSGNDRIIYMAIDAFAEGKKPADCVGCAECEAACPQGIKISEIMADFAERLEKR